VEFADIVDQSDDNMVNDSATIVDDSADVSDIVAGFGVIPPNNTATGNLFEDDDLIGGPGADGITPVIGADGFQGMVSFTYQSGPLVTDTTTIVASDTVTTFLGGTIEVDFATGDYFYTAPTDQVSGTDHFTYVLLDGDDDPLDGVLDILVGAGGTSADNAGFETNTLLFWSAAGSVWVSDNAAIANTEGDFYAVLHTGNNGIDGGGSTFNLITNPEDRDIPTDTQLEGFLGIAAGSFDTLAGSWTPQNSAIEGTALKGSFNVATPGDQYDVSFDWQLLTDQSTVPSGPNDFAFAVIEGQLFLLANSDNLGSPLATSADITNVLFDGQEFGFGTTFQEDEVITVTDDGDGVIEVAFGVVHAHQDPPGTAGINAASALIIDDIQVTPA
jgi:hypothetical protein